MEVSSGPVGSVYQKTRIQAEIRKNETEKFWEKTEVNRLCLLFIVSLPLDSRV